VIHRSTSFGELFWR